MSETLGERLLRLKREKRMSYRAIGSASGLGETAARDIIFGRAKSPKLETLEKIARALGVSVSYLAAGDARMEGLEEDPGDAFVAASDSLDDVREAFERVKSDPELRDNPAVRDLALSHARFLARYGEGVGPGGMVEMSGAEVAAVPRYDAAMSAGAGSIIDPEAEPIGHWFIEAQWLRAVTNTAPSRLAVLRVSGDSMEDTLADGDWVLVDRGQTRASQEGIYALQVADSTWVKRLTLNLREKLIRVISDNPRYPVQELPENELSVIGRIVWIVARKV